MGYFSNGSEGDCYQEEYCDKCINYDEDIYSCPIWDLHLFYNYDGCNKKDSLLHKLIPIKDGYNQKCLMFKKDLSHQKD